MNILHQMGSVWLEMGYVGTLWLILGNTKTYEWPSGLNLSYNGFKGIFWPIIVDFG